LIIELTNDIIFKYAVIFCRVGSVLLLLPGLGETYVSARSRLALALMLSLVFYPLLESVIPSNPPSVEATVIYCFKEVTIGIFFGLLTRIIISTLHIAGMKISFMNGLSAATLFDTNQASQGSVIGVFLSLIAFTVFFTTGMHKIFFAGIYESYQVIPVNQPLPIEDFAYLSTQFMSEAFMMAFKIASPIIVIGLLLYVAAGLISRLMPSMQVFFVLAPVQISVSFFILMLCISTSMMVYLNFFEDKIISLFQ